MTLLPDSNLPAVKDDIKICGKSKGGGEGLRAASAG
jgi:hypothetical protein